MTENYTSSFLTETETETFADTESDKISQQPPHHPLASQKNQRFAVEDIQPLILDNFTWKDCQIKAKNPINFKVTIDEEEEFLEIEKPDLGIFVFAETRSQLIEELNEQVLFLWQAYALDEDAKLTLDAQSLKYSLRAQFESVS
ncbi:MAG: hypothetical protein QM537_05030 [Candidatus Symbiobacter sp.]|nr:hypothetical protein [Candidatus Symbiobacter sp.]